MGGWGSILNTSQAALQYQTRQLAALQETISSGLRLRHASDAPPDAFRLLALRSESQSLQTYGSNLAQVDDSLNLAMDVLQDVSDVYARVRELTTQGMSGTYSASSRQPIAQELNSLLEQLVSLANTKHSGRYLFGGSDTTSAPYEAEYEDSRIVRVTYTGSGQGVMVPVAPGVEYSGVLVGDEIFRTDGRQSPEFLGDTGAAAGAGTSTVRGQVWLAVSHDATAYAGASGIAAGTSSAAGDTVLGNGHVLTVDAPNHTLCLDGGATVTFADGQTDVQVSGPGGAVVYVSVAGLDPAFQGDVALSASGTFSLDGGTTRTAIDFANADLAVIDPATGRALRVDCTGIGQTGLEPVRVPGTYDMFSAVMAVRDLMLNTRDLPEAQQLAYLQEAVKAVNEVAQGLTAAETSVGAGIGVLATLGTSLENIQARTDDQAAALEDADIVQVATDLSRQQTLYEMTLASTARLLSLSLFDYIG